MPTRTDHHQRFDGNGNLIEEKVVEVDITEETNESTLRERAENAMADLRTIAGSSGTLTGAQLSNAVRQLAKVNIALIRFALRKFDSAD